MSAVVDLSTRLGIGLAVFMSSNVDDLLLLAAFFAIPNLRHRSVVAGQFLGIGVLVAVSAAAALTSVALPPLAIRFLGIIPIGIGLHQLRSRRRDASAEPTPGVGKAVEGARSQVLAVAGTTVANGGDNLGIYIPLFASSTGWIWFFTVLFVGLTALWCWLAFSLATHRLTGTHVTRHARRWLPLVLIGLGAYILSGSPVPPWV